MKDTKDQIWQQLKNDKTLVYGEPILDVFLKVIGAAGTDPLFGSELINQSLDKAHYLELSNEKRRMISPSNRVAHYANDLDDLEDAIKLGASVNSLNFRLLSEARKDHRLHKDRPEFIRYLIENGADDFVSASKYAVRKADTKLLEDMITRIENKHAVLKLPSARQLRAVEILLNESLTDAVHNLAKYLKNKSIIPEFVKKQFNLIKFLVDQKEIEIPRWLIDMVESYSEEINENNKKMYEELIQYLNSKYKKSI